MTSPLSSLSKLLQINTFETTAAPSQTRVNTKPVATPSAGNTDGYKAAALPQAQSTPSNNTILTRSPVATTTPAKADLSALSQQQILPESGTYKNVKKEELTSLINAYIQKNYPNLEKHAKSQKVSIPDYLEARASLVNLLIKDFAEFNNRVRQDYPNIPEESFLIPTGDGLKYYKLMPEIRYAEKWMGVVQKPSN